jgi:hypothetical protein
MAALVAVAGAMPAASAFAQPSEPLFTLAAGVKWMGGVNLGAQDANETTASGGAYRLFTSETELGSTMAFETGFGVRLARRLHAELLLSFGQADLRTDLSSDVEGIPNMEASESIDELTVQGSARVDLSAWQLPGQAMPFLAAGGGYLRHLHEGRMLVESGSVFHAGGGILAPLTRSAALRFDARAEIRNGGAIPDDGPHVSPSLGASFVWKF